MKLSHLSVVMLVALYFLVPFNASAYEVTLLSGGGEKGKHLSSSTEQPYN